MTDRIERRAEEQRISREEKLDSVGYVSVEDSGVRVYSVHMRVPKDTHMAELGELLLASIEVSDDVSRSAHVNTEIEDDIQIMEEFEDEIAISASIMSHPSQIPRVIFERGGRSLFDYTDGTIREYVNGDSE